MKDTRAAAAQNWRCLKCKCEALDNARDVEILRPQDLSLSLCVSLRNKIKHICKINKSPPLPRWPSVSLATSHLETLLACVLLFYFLSLYVFLFGFRAFPALLCCCLVSFLDRKSFQKRKKTWKTTFHCLRSIRCYFSELESSCLL